MNRIPMVGWKTKHRNTFKAAGSALLLVALFTCPVAWAAGATAITGTVEEETAIGLATSQNPSTLGQSISFTATVTPSNGVGLPPDGTVSFANGATVLCASVTLTNGWAACSTSSLPIGVNAITATFSGDLSNEIQASGPAMLSQDVLSASTTTLGSSPNPSNYGVPVTFVATINPTTSVAVTGAVIFYDGAAQIGTASVSSSTNIATFTTSTLAPGAHSITAAYQDDTANGASNSASLTQTVNQTQTATNIVAIPNPGIAGVPVVLSATVAVTAGANTTTGTVTFTDGISTVNGMVYSPLGSTGLNFGSIALMSVTLAPGQHLIIATYSGDTDDVGSASATLSFRVAQATTLTMLTSTPNPSVVLGSVTYTATVSGNGGIPGGSVNFLLSGGTSLGSAPLNASGIATLSSSMNAAGRYQITAVYGGDSNDTGSTSAVLTQVVGAIPTVTDFSLSVTPASVSLAAAQNANLTVTLASNSGFTDTIGLSCASLPATVTCHFSAINVGLAANATQSVQLTIGTNAPLSGSSTATNKPGSVRKLSLAALLLPFNLFLGWSLRRIRRRSALYLTSMLLALSSLLLVGGCSNITQSSAAPGTYVIQIVGVGANSNISHYQNVTITMTK